MSQEMEIRLVRCGSDNRTEVINTTVSTAKIEELLIREVEQNLEADLARGLHLAADDPEHGPVTYLQQVVEGGFFVYTGDPDQLDEHWAGPGDWIGFCDNDGSGHASKVGPEGVKRIMRILRGQLQ